MDERLFSPGLSNINPTAEKRSIGLSPQGPGISSRSNFAQASEFSLSASEDGGDRDYVLPTPDEIQRTSRSLDVHHASPLAPLRKRDSAALSELFNCEQLNEITLDIHRYLARTYPEPCWEDEPFEFLNGYI